MIDEFNAKKINLEIIDVSPFIDKEHEGIIIELSSDAVFGECVIYKSKNDNIWRAKVGELGASNGRKLVNELMRLFTKQLVIEKSEW